MKKLVILSVFCFLFYFSQAYTISKNGARKRCFKKIKKSAESSSNNDNSNYKSVKVSCQSLVTEVNSGDITDFSKLESSSDDSNNTINSYDASINSDDEQPSSNKVSINYIDNLVIPKGTIINDNEECVTAIYKINKLIKQTTNSNIFEQSCDVQFDLNAFTEGLKRIKTELSSYMDDAISKCGNSEIWNGAKLHQACRVLSQTGQTVCHSIVDEAYEKYEEKCLKDATLSDMWEFSTWLWDQLININNGCYLKQLYNYKCSPKKDAIVHMGSNSYSLRLLCESNANSCDWPGTYTGSNSHVQCLSKTISKNKNIAINVLKKNGYVCENTKDLPRTLFVEDDGNESSDDEEPLYATDNSSSTASSGTTTNDGIPVINSANKVNTNNNNPASDINTDPDKKTYIVSSGSEPWTNTNQIIGTIFIALFALLF